MSDSMFYPLSTKTNNVHNGKKLLLKILIEGKSACKNSV